MVFHKDNPNKLNANGRAIPMAVIPIGSKCEFEGCDKSQEKPGDLSYWTYPDHSFQLFCKTHKMRLYQDKKKPGAANKASPIS
jgi:hypothetical protein